MELTEQQRTDLKHQAGQSDYAMRDPQRRGIGRLLAFALTLILAAAAPDWRVLDVLCLAVLLALFLSRSALGRLARDRTLPILALLAVGLGAVMGERDLPIGAVYLSSYGLSLGAQMTVRASAILLAVYTLTTTMSLSTLASLFERLGFKGLGFALGVAVNAIPLVQRTADDVLTALRLRGGFRRRRLRALRLLLLTTIVNSLRHADDIIAAAESRGFRVDRARPAPLTWGTEDLLLLVFLLAAALTILLR